MHTLHLVKTSETAIWVYNMMKEFKNHDFDVTFSILLPSGGRYFEKYFDVCRNVYVFDFVIDRNILKRGNRLREIVRLENPDIVHSWYTQTTFYARLFLRDFRIPRIFEVLGPLHLEFPLFRFFDFLSAGKNDYWKTTSKCTYNLYLKYGAKKNKLYFNYIGVDLRNIIERTNASPKENLREKYQIPSEKKIIGTASYMYPPKLFRKHGVKNHELLLKVFEKLLKKRNDVVLVIGGTTLGPDKTYEIKLKNVAKSINSEKIIFTGWVNDLGSLITEFDVFVFLSMSENLGGVFESLLYKVPTVSSDKGGIPELVVDGETGISCSLKSVDEIVEKIELILNDKDLKESLKENGFNKVHEVFDIERSTIRSYEIYREVINSI